MLIYARTSKVGAGVALFQRRWDEVPVRNGSQVRILPPALASTGREPSIAGALLPDLANLRSWGMKTNSTLPTPEAFYNNEWIVNHPTWAVWYLSHSLLFWAIVVVPLFRYQSRMMFSLFRAWCHMAVQSNGRCCRRDRSTRIPRC